MEDIGQKQIEQETSEPQKLPSDSRQLAKIGARALFLAFAAVAFLLTLFTVFFPYPSMKTYMKMGLKSRALECADSYYNMNAKKYSSSSPEYDSRFADALYAGVNLSSSLLESKLNKNGSSSAVKNAAKYADKFASAYLSYSSLDERSKLVDSYSLSHSLPSMHASVYSFENSVAVLREKARFVLNGAEYSLGYFFDTLRDDLLLNNNAFVLTDESVDKYIRIFNQISAVIDYELTETGFYSEAEFTPNGGAIKDSVSNGNLDFDGSQFSLLYLRDELKISENGQAFRGISPLLKWASSEQQLENDPRGIEYWLPQITVYVQDYPRDYALANSAAWAKKVFWAKSLSDFTERVYNAFLIMDCNLEAYNEDRHGEISDCADVWEELNQIETDNGAMSLTEWYRFKILPDYTAYLSAL